MKKRAGGFQLSKGLDPWERHPGEPPGEWEAFRYYRDLGPGRTLEKTSKDGQFHRGSVTAWNRTHLWADRVLAYDNYIDGIERKKSEAGYYRKVAAFRDRQLKLTSLATESAAMILAEANKSIARLRQLSEERDKAIAAAPDDVLPVNATKRQVASFYRDKMRAEVTFTWKALPQLYRVAVSIIESASTAEANALALEDVLDNYERTKMVGD